MLIIFVSLVLILSKSDKSTGCGLNPTEDDSYYLLFSQNTINSENFAPFYYSSTPFLYITYDQDSIKKVDNILDWATNTGLLNTVQNDDYYKTMKDKDYQKVYLTILKKGIYKELEYLIYKSNLTELDEILYFLENKTNKVNKSEITCRKFFSLPDSDKSEYIEYLKFAKKCDLALNGTSKSEDFYADCWLEKEPVDSTKWPELINEGEVFIKRARHDFIKMRYTYQMVRLAHYSRFCTKCINLFDKYTPESQIGSLIYYWALGHKAAALGYYKKSAEANYSYSQIFANCRSKRLSAYQSFHIDEQKIWDSVMSLCKNPNEKSACYAIRGIDNKNDGISEMDSIYRTDPNSEFLALLLSREITKLEFGLMKLNYRPTWQEYEFQIVKNKEYNLNNLKRLKTFIGNVISDKLTKRHGLWPIANAYLEFINGDYKHAEKKVLDCENIPNLDSSEIKQLKVIILALIARNAKTITDSLENVIYDMYEDIISFNSNNESGTDMTMKYILDKFAYTYYKQGDFGKSFLCSHCLYELYPNPKDIIVNSLLAFYDKPDKNDFEEFLIRKSSLKCFDIYAWQLTWDGERYKPNELQSQILIAKNDAKCQLYEMKGTNLLSQGKYSEAAEYFSKLKNSYMKYSDHFNIPADPFYGYLEGQYNFNFAKYSRNRYNKLTFAQKMLELEQLVTQNQDKIKVADACYQLGNAHYNTTYFGPCWKALAFTHTLSQFFTDNETEDLKDKQSQPFDKKFYDIYQINSLGFYSQKNAIKYYTKAMKQTTSREFKAKISFMLAKCEQNEHYFYVNKTNHDFKKEEKKNNRTWFAKLKTDYSNTKFYDEAVSNCSYFSYFIK
ncbi:MAG: hypothetical protein NT007_06480 [Candidatus Kapabacteria bacterium]|nr:hypothetical protein [Candidatus Kapabacteria bacterium]